LEITNIITPMIATTITIQTTEEQVTSSPANKTPLYIGIGVTVGILAIAAVATVITCIKLKSK